MRLHPLMAIGTERGGGVFKIFEVCGILITKPTRFTNFSILFLE